MLYDKLQLTSKDMFISVSDADIIVKLSTYLIITILGT